MVRSKQRFRIYLGCLLATAGLIVAACFVVNCLIDPLWYLRGNVLTGINYPFNERLAAIIRFLPRQQEYDCIILGTSRASLLPDENIQGYHCYNLSFSDGQASEYLRLAFTQPPDVLVRSAVALARASGLRLHRGGPDQPVPRD